MIDEETKNLLKKYLEGIASGEEKARAEHWIASELQKEPSTDVTWNDTRKQKLLARIHDKINEPAREKAVSLRQWVKVAAAILLIATTSFYAWQFTHQKHELLSENGIGIEKVILPDGTIVWLKANSKLFYPETFTGTRNVRLEGEALFEVFKDAKHPFVIQCGELTATVLGTSFNIRESKDTIEVAVLTGKVGLTSGDNQETIIIQPHEKAIYAAHQIAKLETTPTEVEGLTATTEYSMDFKKTRMREILERIEGKFGVNIKLQDSDILNCSLTADFTDQSLDVTLRNIANVLDFEYSIGNKIVTISGGSCQ